MYITMQIVLLIFIFFSTLVCRASEPPKGSLTTKSIDDTNTAKITFSGTWGRWSGLGNSHYRGTATSSTVAGNYFQYSQFHIFFSHNFHSFRPHVQDLTGCKDKMETCMVRRINCRYIIYHWQNSPGILFWQG